MVPYADRGPQRARAPRARRGWQDDQLTLYCLDTGHQRRPRHHRRAARPRPQPGSGRRRARRRRVRRQAGAVEADGLAALVPQDGSAGQVMHDRRAENLAAGKRNATVQHVRSAPTDGRLVAIDADIWPTTAPTPSPARPATCRAPTSTSTSATTCGPCPAGLHRTPARRSRSARPATSRRPSHSSRRWTSSPAARHRPDRAAPPQLTERDQKKELPWSSPDALRGCYDRVDRGGRPGEARTATRRLVRGRGFAAHEWMAATASPPGYAWVEFNSDGTVHVVTVAQDIGTGTRTVLTQVVAEEMGIAVDRIRVTLGDTAGGPPAPTSAGSATIPTMAPAVRAAAADVRRAGARPRRRAAGYRPGPAALRRHHHHVRCGRRRRPRPGRSARRARPGGHPRSRRAGRPARRRQRPHLGAAVADVEVDTRYRRGPGRPGSWSHPTAVASSTRCWSTAR